MHTTHAGYSFVSPIIPGKENEVTKLLSALDSTTGHNVKLLLSKCTTTLFVSGFVIPEQDYHGKMLPASLLFLTTYTGPLKIHIDELVKHCGEGLRELFKYCKDISAEALNSDNGLRKILVKNNYPDTFYTGLQYITHADIVREDKLREFIEGFLDVEKTTGLHTKTGTEVRKKIQDAVKQKEEFSWAQTIWKRSFRDFWGLYGSLIIFGMVFLLYLFLGAYLIRTFFGVYIVLGILIALAAVIVALGLLVLCFRINEMRKHFVAPRQRDEKIRKIFEGQKHPVLNKMTVGAPLKKGWIRPVFLFIVLRLAFLLRGLLYIPTVASARWLTMDRGRRLIFNSNFGNLSESYVRDFIDSKKRARNINLIYGQGIGYPLTKWVRGGGAITNPEGFINDVHLMDHPIPLWYWPYQHLSVDNIINNRKIYLGLFADLNENEIKEWLKLL